MDKVYDVQKIRVRKQCTKCELRGNCKLIRKMSAADGRELRFPESECPYFTDNN